MKNQDILIKSSREDYWRTKFSISSPDYLMCFKPGIVPDANNPVSHSVSIDADQIAKIKILINNSSMLEYVFYLSALNIALHRYSRHEIITIGSSGLSEVKEDDFSDGLKLFKVELTGQESFKDVFTKVKQEVLDTINQSCSFDELQQVLNHDQVNALTQVGLHLEGVNEASEIYGTFSLLLKITDSSDGGADVTLISQNDSISESSITEFFLRNFVKILSAVSENMYCPIHELDIIDEKELNAIQSVGTLKEVENTVDITIHEWFFKQSNLTPDDIAIIENDFRLSYIELNRRSNQLAHYIVYHGIKPGELVGILSTSPSHTIIAILAILKSGAAYVPIDPDYPNERIEYMLNNASAKLVIADDQYDVLENDSPHYSCIRYDLEIEKINKQSTDEPNVNITGDNLAYVIYTSGSTGNPKGVEISHVNLADYFQGLFRTGILNNCESFGLMSSLTADLGNTILFGSLLSGGALHLFTKDELRSPVTLHNYFENNPIDCMKIVPSHWRALELENSMLLPHQTLMFGGEALAPQMLKSIDSTVTCTVINHYGPTETTIGKLFHVIDHKNDYARVPIGRPFTNMELYIVDKYFSIVPFGVPGELLIGGAGVSSGYVNNPKLTAEKFIHNPFKENGAILYRTGDLVRQVPDGNIEFLGRVDNQIKIRGYRVELEEIEKTLKQNDQIKDFAVTSRLNGEEVSLVGYVVAGDNFDQQSLLAWSQTKLPDYMIPGNWVTLDSLPLNLNGKVDKNRLPEPIIENNKEIIRPQNDIEKGLLEIWSDLLEMDKEGISVVDDFFKLGGHSLLAIRILAAIAQRFEVEVRIRDFFLEPNIRAMGKMVSDQAGIAPLPFVRAEKRPDSIPLSFSQERLWFIDKLQGSSNYHIPTVLRMKGKLDKDALSFAFTEIVNRHEVLRTVFEEHDGLATQKVLPEGQWKLSFVDQSMIENDLEGYIKEEINRPFDLSQDLMLRMKIIKLSQDEHIMILVMHHIASDGWSQGIFIKEFTEYYESRQNGRLPNLPELKLQYADFALWQRKYLEGEALDEKLKYWKKRLDGAEILDLPTDFPRPSVQSTNGALLYFNIEEETASQLRNLAQEGGTTLFIVLMTIFKILMFRYTGQTDISVGTAIAGRTQKEVDPLIGFFINTLVLRNDLGNNPTFNELLERVKSTTLEAYSHQDVPFEKIVEKLERSRDASRTPLFQTMLVLQNTPISESSELENLTLSWVSAAHETSKFDLIFNIEEESNGLNVSVEYCTDLFLEDTIQRLISHYKKLISCVLTNPSEGIARMKMSLPEEIDLLQSYGIAEGSYPEESTLVELVSDSAIKHGDSVALAYKGGYLSYSELASRSDSIAGLLQSLGVGKEDLVPIISDRSIDFVVMILGIFKAGAAYVPLDVDYPEERLLQILEDCGSDVVVVSEAFMRSSFAWVSTNVRHVLLLGEVLDKNTLDHHFRTELFNREVLRTVDAQSFNDLSGSDLSDVRLWDSGDELSLSALSHRVCKLADFIQESGVGRSSVVGLLIEQPLLLSTAVLALQSLNLPYYILEANQRRSTHRQMILASGINFLLSEQLLEDEADALYWESGMLSGYLIIAGDKVEGDKHFKEEGFREIFNFQADNRSASLNGYGWNNSYDGDSFTMEEMQEYVENFRFKFGSHLSKSDKVLEIGCGHGIVAFELADKVGSYVATDIANAIIDHNNQLAQERNLDHLRFASLAANEIDMLKDEGPFDHVIISSAVHYFPSARYLEEVILKCMSLLGDEGVIYLDDLLDLDKKEALVSSMIAYKNAHPSAPTKTEWDNDLFVSRSFFDYLSASVREIASIDISTKRGKLDNELTRYRYDVKLTINKKRKVSEARSDVHRYAVDLKTPYLLTRSEVWHHISDSYARVGHLWDYSDLSDYESADLSVSPTPKDLAYVIYTSGSTGKPKGVMIEHGGMLNHLYAKINELELDQHSVIAQNSSSTFDISVWQMLSGLLVGGRSVIYDRDTVLDIQFFMNEIARDQVTILEVVPSYLEAMLEELAEGNTKDILSSVDKLLVTGEPLHKGLVSRWFSLYPNKTLVNAYGPTEASDDITHLILTADPAGDHIPVGRVLQNLEIHVLNDWDEPCAIGVPGEICVSGEGVGRGYLNNADLTADRFVPHPVTGSRMYRTGDIGRWLADGNLLCLGRKDDQVKIRGHRIELGDIESALKGAPSVNTGAVVVQPDANEMLELVGYVVVGSDYSYADVQQHLKRKLPAYMVPSQVIKVGELPLTPNGKIDRKKLAKNSHSHSNHSQHVDPRTPMEEELSDIWRELLSLTTVSVFDNFFEIGGHSLLATRVASAVNKKFEVQVPIKVLFELNRIADLAEYIELQLPVDTNQQEVELNTFEL